MAAEVKVLIEGYTNADSIAETGEEKNCPTISLVRDENIIMVVDPGVLEDQQILIQALAKEGLTVEDINFVCISHSHIDHYRNIGMFPKAKVLEFFGIWDKNTVSDWSERFSQNIQIVRTPGHNQTDITLFVATKNGIVAICGDVFWKENYPSDPRDDRFASNSEKLKASRELVLKMADWVVPGHGPIFKVKDPEVKNSDQIKKEIAAAIKTITCKKCRKIIIESEKCKCRPGICFLCCECGLDCDVCSCSHKSLKIEHGI